MNILLVGFYGEGNLGDNTILNSIVSNIPDRHKLFITSGSNASSARGFKIKRRGISSWIPFIHNVKQCKHTIFSGGILQDWSFEGVTFFALRILAAHMAKSNVSLWGAGLGPVNRKGLLPLVKKSLNRVNCAWLRDEESKSFFETISGKSAYLGTDWSWGTNIVQEQIQNKKLTGINLREWRKYDFIKLVRKELELSKGEFIGLAARTNDTKVIKGLSNKIRVIKLDDFENLLLLCNQLQKGIAMRYHIALAMIRGQVPVKLIPYDNKVISLANEANVDIISEKKSHFKVAHEDFLNNSYKKYDCMKSAFHSYLDQVS